MTELVPQTATEKVEDFARKVGFDIGVLFRTSDLSSLDGVAQAKLALDQLVNKLVELTQSSAIADLPLDSSNNLLQLLQTLPSELFSQNSQDLLSNIPINPCGTAQFDFKNAEPPKLVALRKSREDSQYEKEIKQLVLDLFCKLLAAKAFDANVLGAPHLGSFGLVQQVLDRDDLLSAKLKTDEVAMRYLMRAWTSQKAKRGLHFLKTAMQLLFPNAWEVNQLYQKKTFHILAI